MINYKKDKSYIKQRLEYVNSVDYISELEEQIENLQIEKEDYKLRIDKAIEYINKHCVNERISKEVGYKCYTMADTNELEKIIKILGGGIIN